MIKISVFNHPFFYTGNKIIHDTGNNTQNNY